MLFLFQYVILSFANMCTTEDQLVKLIGEKKLVFSPFDLLAVSKGKVILPC